VLLLSTPCLVVRSGTSSSPRAVHWRLGQSDLEPGQPTAVACPASSEVIDALLGTKGGSPRVVPNETKLAITNAHRTALPDLRLSEQLGIVVSSWYYRRCSSIIPCFTIALYEPVHFSNACSLRRSRQRLN
jgi:hypothetical protein